MLLRRWNSVREWRRSLKLRRVRRSYAAKPQLATNSKQTRKDGGGGGSRTPVRKALRHEDYMLSSIRCATRPLRARRPFASRAQNERSEEHTSELQSLRHLVCRL